MAARKRSSIPRERTFVMIAGAVLAAPVAVWLGWVPGVSLDGPARGHSAICPTTADQPLVVLTYDSRYFEDEDYSDRSYTEVYDRYVVYDLANGEVVHRVDLGTRRVSYGESSTSAACLGVTGENVWLQTGKDGYHVRELRTGRMVKSQQELFAGLPAPVDSTRFDADGARLVVNTKDGRSYAIDASFVSAASKPLTSTAGTRQKGRTGHWIESNIRPGYNRSGAGVLSEKGGPRRSILVADALLAGTDWLQPEYLVHPPSGSLEWPDPPSLVVCEPVEINGPRRQITRVALDGTILWTYQHDPVSRPGLPKDCRWHTSGGGDRLLLFTVPNGLIGLDPATGVESFRRLL